MLNECRKALKITTEAYDGELCSLMDAAAKDLKIAGVVLPGTVAFEIVSTTSQGVTTTSYQDNSTLKDALVMRAIFTYVHFHFYPNAAEADRMKGSYDEQKAQLMSATGYTDYGEDPEPEADDDEGEGNQDGGEGE